jgi:hypothetical protein
MKYMSFIFTMIAVIGITYLAKADVDQLGRRINVENVLPVAAITANGDSSAIDLNIYSGNCAAIIDVSAPVAGTNPTLAFKLTESATSGGSYTDVAGGGFTTVSGTALVQTIVFNKNETKRYLKLNRVIGGTASPQYLASSKILCDKKYR